MASQWFLDWNQRGGTLIYLLFCTTAFVSVFSGYAGYVTAYLVSLVA